MEFGPETLDALVGAMGVNPVGQQNHTDRLLQIQPERCSGKAEMTDGGGSKVPAAARSGLRGRIETSRPLAFFTAP